MWKAACKDVGVDCPFEIRTEDRAEVLTMGLEHARVRHQYEITPNLVESFSKGVRQVALPLDPEEDLPYFPETYPYY